MTLFFPLVISLVVFSLSWLHPVLVYAGVPPAADIDHQINVLQERLKLDDGYLTLEETLIKAGLWKNLGILLVSRDIRVHEGGGKGQNKAIDAFNNALDMVTYIEERESGSLLISTHYYKGILLKLMGLGHQSLRSFEIALGVKAIVPTNVDKASIYYNQGETLFMMGRLEDAILAFRTSLGLHPCKVDRYYSLVNAQKERRKLSKAEWVDLLQEIQLMLQQCSTGSHPTQHSNDNDDDEDDGDDEEDEDENLFESDEVPAGNDWSKPVVLTASILDISGDRSPATEYKENADVYWALHIAADQAQRFSKSWYYLETGNNLEKTLRPMRHQREESVKQSDNIIKVFNKNFWAGLPALGETASKVPIFIVGMMRSGSTLLETMLDAHSAIYGMGEDSILNANLTPFRDKLVKLSSKTVKFAQEGNLKGMEDGNAAVRKHILKFGKKIAKDMKKVASDKYAGNNVTGNAIPEESVKKIKHVVDKMLFNYRNIGFIHMIYPNAIILHTVRDPMDTMFSCYKNKFDDHGLEWTLDQSDLISQYVQYLKIMHHWRSVLPGRVVDVRYEDLVSQPELVLRPIIEDRLGLEWEEAVMNFHNTKRAVNTHSMTQVRHAVYKYAMGSWIKYKDQGLQPMIQELRAGVEPLLDAGMLPFEDSMNWEIATDYDYDAWRKGVDTSDATASVEEETCSVDSRGSSSC